MTFGAVIAYIDNKSYLTSGFRKRTRNLIQPVSNKWLILFHNRKIFSRGRKDLAGLKMIRKVVDRRRQARIRHSSTQTRGGSVSGDNVRINDNVFVPHPRNRNRGRGGNRGGGIQTPSDAESAPPTPIEQPQEPQEDPNPSTSSTVPHPTPADAVPTQDSNQVLISLALLPVIVNENDPSIFIPLLIRQTLDPAVEHNPVTVMVEPVAGEQVPATPSSTHSSDSLDDEVQMPAASNLHFTMNEGVLFVEERPINEATVPTGEAAVPTGTEAGQQLYVFRTYGTGAQEVNNNTIYAHRANDGREQMFVSDGLQPSFIPQAFGPLFPDEALDPTILNRDFYENQALLPSNWINPNEPQPGTSYAPHSKPSDSLIPPPPPSSPESD